MINGEKAIIIESVNNFKIDFYSRISRLCFLLFMKYMKLFHWKGFKNERERGGEKLEPWVKGFISVNMKNLSRFSFYIIWRFFYDFNIPLILELVMIFVRFINHTIVS